MTTSKLTLALTLALGALGACGESPATPTSEEVGEVRAAITMAPSSVKCINVRAVNGGTTVNNAFNIVPGEATSLVVTNIPVGNDTMSAQAYSVICASIGGATATYVADNVTVAVSAVPNTVTLAMRPANMVGPVTATVNFPDVHGFVKEFNVSPIGSGIAAGPDGNIWYSAGSSIGQFVVQWGFSNQYPLPAPIQSVNYIIAGSDGYLWFTGFGTSGQSLIVRMTPDGVSFAAFTVSASNVQLTSLTPGSDGNIWFTEGTNNKIGHIVPLTGAISEFSLPTANTSPGWITTGADGNVWFVEAGLSKIGRLTPSLVYTDFALPTSPSLGLIVAGPDGNLWFTEPNTNKIGRITTAGVVTEFANTTPGSLPLAITAGPDGNLWFNEISSNTLGRITPAGVISHFEVPTLGAVNGTTLATGADGGIWFSEPFVNKIARLTP